MYKTKNMILDNLLHDVILALQSRLVAKWDGCLRLMAPREQDCYCMAGREGYGG